jgi:simple sugar transport system substrate-binding protein
MADTDQVQDAGERLELMDRTQPRTPGFDRRAFLRRTAMTGVAAGSVGTLLSACGSSSNSSSASGGGGTSGIFGSHPSYKFVVVNHVTTNSFFVPTQYGIADACKLLGCSYEWTGSESENIDQMVNAINTAVSSGADGIAVSLISNTAFNTPVENALKAGIPVIAYNADSSSNKRLAYVGQDLKLAGELMGKRIVEDVGSGDVVIFTASAGSANLQPRLEGAEKAIKASGAAIKLTTIVTGSLESGEKTAIEAYWTGHQGTKGMYAVDGGDTAELAGVMQKLGLNAKGVKAGGFDLAEKTQKGLHEGFLEFTIDQQPYLQGFMPILQMFLWHVSGSLSGPAEVNTGLKFVDKESITPYVNSKSRYEGTSTEAKVIPIAAGAPA